MESELFMNLIIVVLFYSIGAVSAIGIVLLLLFSVFEYIKSHKIQYLFVKFVVSIILLFGIVLSLPYYLTAIAYHQDTFEKSEKYLIYAKNTAIIPPFRAGVLYMLRSLYQVNYEGQKAIDAYEEAVKIAAHEDKLEKAMICFVYFAKPDREKILQTCSDRTIAVDYIRTKEYNKALELINQSIKNSEAENKMNNVCSGYAIRAAIYKQTGDEIAYKKDYDKVNSECSYYKFAKQYAEADNILDVYIKNKDKFKF